MGKSTKTENKTTNEPPQWARPLFTKSAEWTKRLLGADSGFHSPGQTMVGPSTATQMGIAGLLREANGDQMPTQAYIPQHGYRPFDMLPDMNPPEGYTQSPFEDDFEKHYGVDPGLIGTMKDPPPPDPGFGKPVITKVKSTGSSTKDDRKFDIGRVRGGRN